GAAHAALNDVLAVGLPGAKATLQLLHRGRKNEDGDEVAPERALELLRALPIDVEKDVAPGLQRLLDRFLRAAVAVVEDIGPFRELFALHHALESGVVDEMIVPAFDFTGAYLASGRADRH